MENMNRNTEQQVWQRVFAQLQAQPGQEDLRMLALSAMELAAGHRLLTGLLTGSAREQAVRLWEEELANIACLKGMQRLSGGAEVTGRMPNAPKEPARRLLEKSYHRTRRAVTEYTARLADPEFGAVFQKMADREREHCAVIAELLGGKL